MTIMRAGRWFFLAPLALVGFAAFMALGGAAVMWLWNWLTPPLFGFKAVSFWQALGLLALTRLLFGGFRLHGGGRRRWGRGKRPHFYGPTPEERQRFKDAVRQRYGRPGESI